MAIDFATETTLRALSPALSPLSTEATQLALVSAITSASGGVALASETTAQSIDTHVQELLTDAELRATPVDVAVTSSALPTGASTEATLQSVDTHVQELLTDAELRATPVPVSGTVALSQNASSAPYFTQPVLSDYCETAFGEARVSVPYTLIDLMSKYGRDTRETDTSVSGGGAVTNVTGSSAFKLAVGATNGDYAKVRTNTWFRYQAGRGQAIILTCIHEDSGKANQTRNWGYFDNNDGLGFRLSGTTAQIFRRTSTGEGGGSVGSPYEEVVDKASWNQDTYNSLDFTKGNIYEIRFQWLGVGVVKFFINGTLVHKMIHPNTLAYPYMGTGTLPLTWEVINTAASTASSMSVICGHVTSQSGQEPPFWGESASASYTSVAAGEVPVLSYRLKSTINSVDNRIVVLPRFVEITETAGNDCIIYIRLNPTLTGATFAGSAGTLSGVEYDTAATATTGGDLLERIICNGSESLTMDKISYIFQKNARKMTRGAYTGTSDILSISVARVGAGNVTTDILAYWAEVK